MNFVYPAILLLLPLLPLVAVLWFFLGTRAARRLNRLILPGLVDRLAPRNQRLLFILQLILATAGLLLLTLAAARPQWGFREETIASRSRNLLVAVDVSRSMLARDVHPDRLGRAKADILDLIADLKGDRAALLAFRNKAVLLCPLTTDTTFLRQSLENLSPDIAPAGPTDLAAAIHTALDALEPTQDDHNAILLISDGEELTGSAVEAAQKAAKRRVPIFTVGIGDPRGAPIPDPKTGANLQFQGVTVTTALNESALRAIASVSGGTYIPLATHGTAHTTLGSIYRNHLRTIAAREQQETKQRQIQERYHLFLIPALLLLLAAAALSRGRLAATRQNEKWGEKNAPRGNTTPPATSLRGNATPSATTPPPSQKNRFESTLLDSNRLESINASAISHQPSAIFSALSPQPLALLLLLFPLSSLLFADAPNGIEAARRAQSLLKSGDPAQAAEVFQHAARTTTSDHAPVFNFNAALALLQANQPRDALQLLTPLTTDPTLGGRASELIAQITLDQPADTNNQAVAKARLHALTAATENLQRALRDAPAQTTRQQNFARTAPLLAQAREDAHIEDVLARHGQTPPVQLLRQLVDAQRALITATPAAFTNSPAALIAAAERLAQNQRDATDLWIPLKDALLANPSLTNEQDRATVATLVQDVRDTMRTAAAQLDNLDPSALEPVTLSEALPYRLWADSAEAPALIDEDILLQSHAHDSDAPLVPTRPDQPEAHRLTQAFRQRFPAWADQFQQQAAADTNAPALTPETRAEIEQLAAETEDLQYRATLISPERPALQQQALEKLNRIRELLPKQQNQNQQQQQQEQQPNEDQDQQQSQSEDQQDQQQEEKEQPQPEEKEDEEPATPEKVQEMLRRALEREKEREAEKRRQQSIPLAPGEKDW